MSSVAAHRTDVDPEETREWLEALDSVVLRDGPLRADYLLGRQLELARAHGFSAPPSLNTPYLNSIPAQADARAGNEAELERRIEAWVRWNALAMVQRANRLDPNLGGHVASFASAATLYEVGFNHFFRASSAAERGDLVYYQGHASPGIYARAFLQGQLDTAQLDRFRREVDGGGLSSYPHPWLMPNFWQFPSVSMGLSALQAIYQARFMKYLHARSLARTSTRKVWCFLGDGEMDEPESTGALGVAGRENLDNLVFVINCNLQRLDGPVRGNGKIIQELERVFRGAGWNVIKLVWSGKWDALLARDESGLLRARMEECVDGEYQAFRARDAAYFRQHFFGKHPALLELVRDWSDEELWELTWGGHDPCKVHDAYAAASRHQGQPSVILAKTIKGFGMGASGESRNLAHQAKKLSSASAKAFRARFQLELDDRQIEDFEYVRPAESSPEMRLLAARRSALGGLLPGRLREAPRLEVPALSAFSELLEPSAPGRAFSSTKAFAKLLAQLLKDAALGPFVVPIVADEARTFGMEDLFRRYGIWSQPGQLYSPEDAESSNFYHEDERGQVLQEGINEAGAMCSWLSAATSYSTHGVPMIPFYVYYSMFGVQRTGDLWWAAGDSRARGFLLGGTSGRTTLNGEGLQHEDGHSHVWAASIPNCVPYDPTFGHEVAVIIQDGLRRMLAEQEDVFYYVTLMNENYAHPGLGDASTSDLLEGMYLLQPDPSERALRVELLGSGSILLEVLAAAELLQKDWNVAADVWSCPSFTLLGRDGQAAARHNLLHPKEPRVLSHVERCFQGKTGPFIAATDYVRAFGEQIRAFVPGRYVVLGTDGFGRSDTRARLRHFFEVDRHFIVVAALNALADEGRLDHSCVAEALQRYQLDPEKPRPTSV